MERSVPVKQVKNKIKNQVCDLRERPRLNDPDGCGETVGMKETPQPVALRLLGAIPGMASLGEEYPDDTHKFMRLAIEQVMLRLHISWL
ncbi:hypothetical protein C1H46_045282 [Malus baccata]|uniref:Uncharacterized protein n=1 Tax=Malus baccata TaxID=106549 RepID=A0A540K4N3_MALBA|nr:hypothetical protein C1H46_045282 [Malus baccata]